MAMTVWPRIRRAIWTALAAAALCQPASALAQARAAPGSGLDIRLADGRLTMNVSDVPLSRVLKSIAAKGGFELDIAGQLDSKVSASFENVPIERALRRIVGRSSYIIELAPPAGARRHIKHAARQGRETRQAGRRQVPTRQAPRRRQQAESAPPAALSE